MDFEQSFKINFKKFCSKRGLVLLSITYPLTIQLYKQDTLTSSI